MNIENIKSFIAVYKNRSFQKAAETLYITQPTLSSRIKSLEQGLGTTLLARQKGGVVLTKDGEIFLPYALQIVDNYERAIMDISRIPRTVSIGCLTSFSQTILPKVLAILHRDYPHMTPDIIVGTSSELSKKIENGTCSFAILQESLDDNLQHIFVYEDPILFVVSPDHYMAQDNRTYPRKEILHEPLIRFEPKLDYWEKLEDYAGKRGINLNICFQTNRSHTVKAMVKENIGGSFLPELLVHEDLANYKLCNIHFEPDLQLFRRIECVYAQGPEPEFISQFIQALQMVLKKN